LLGFLFCYREGEGKKASQISRNEFEKKKKRWPSTLEHKHGPGREKRRRGGGMLLQENRQKKEVNKSKGRKEEGKGGYR